NEPAQATPVAVPGAITGRFLTSGDIDNYRFTAKKGQKILIEAETLDLYSPTIVYMVVKHAKTGAELAKVTPGANPPLDQRIEFTPPEDGDFILEATHLTYLSGPSEAYRIMLKPVTPNFDLSLGIDRYDVAPNSVAALTVNVARRGYTGPIDVSLQGAAGLTGTLALKANENAGALLVSAGTDVAPGPQVIRVVGKAKIENNVVERRASVRAAVSQSLSNLAYPPRTLFDQVAIAVKEKAPFTLSARFDSEGIPGSPLIFIVSAKRDAGFEDAITLNPPTGLPPNQPALKLPPIAKGQSEVKIKVDVNAKAPFGEFLVLVAGTAKHQGKDFAANSAPVKLVMA